MDGLRRWRKGTLKLLFLSGAFLTTTLTLRAETALPGTSTPMKISSKSEFQRTASAESWTDWQQRMLNQFDEFRVELARELLLASMTMIGGHGMTTPPPPPPPPKSTVAPPTSTPPTTTNTPPPPPPPPPIPSGSGEGPGDPPNEPPPPPNNTPEPASLLSGLLGLASLAGYGWRRRRRNQEA